MLVHLPREQGYRHKETPKNGPALAGYGAVTDEERPGEHNVKVADAAGAIADLGP